MLVEQVAALYRRYTGQPDRSVISADQQLLDLEMGHERYRDVMFKIAPAMEADTVTLTMPGGTNDYNLAAGGAVNLFGIDAALSHQRLISVTALAEWDPVNLVPLNPLWQLLQSDVAQQADELSNPWGACIRGTDLHFTTQPSGDFIIYYRGQGPQPVGQTFGVDWEKTTAGDNEYIDKQYWFHDLIAMYAAKQYDIVRWASNPELVRQFEERLYEFRSHLRRFNGDADTMIQSGQANIGETGWDW